MGSGSSRSGRALRRLRGPDSRPAGSPEGGTGPPASATVGAREEAPGAAAAGGTPSPDPGPAAPSDDRDETLRLLDQLLAESEGWGPGELAPRRPARPRPAACAGSPVTPEHSAEDHPESSASEAPGSSHKRPERQSVILYDYSEEELMASIEQECCR